MNGIDVSSWQKGINLKGISCDFVIVKSTQGVNYVSPEFVKQARQTLESGKKLGIYHYCEGKNFKNEADHFIKHVKPYIGKAILVLDWEAGQNAMFGRQDLEYCKAWLDYVYAETGVKPLLYCQQSIMHKFTDVGDYGLWIAQYANNKRTAFQDKPWNEGRYSCAIRQYSSAGLLPGFSGNLDLNKAYMSAEGWDQYAKSDLAPIIPGWQKNTTGWWYRNADGSYPHDQWLKLDTWYYFNENGYAVTGWRYINDAWYHFGEDCRMTTGWLEDGDNRFYLAPSGYMVTGWLLYENDWYWLNNNSDEGPVGAMLSNYWLHYKNDWYWLKADGKMLKDEAMAVKAGSSGAITELRLTKNKSVI